MSKTDCLKLEEKHITASTQLRFAAPKLAFM